MGREMLETFANPTLLAQAAAAAVQAALSAAIAERGAAVLVATGGRSPAPVYDLLAQAPLDWGSVTVTLSDDRFVPPTSPDSNERLVRDRLLVAKAASAQFTPLSFDVANVKEAALRAEPEVKALAPYDVMLLGMGEDGHVASLIPGSPVMDEGMNPAGERFCLGVPAGVGGPPHPPLTPPLPRLIVQQVSNPPPLSHRQ